MTTIRNCNFRTMNLNWRLPAVAYSSVVFQKLALDYSDDDRGGGTHKSHDGGGGRVANDETTTLDARSITSLARFVALVVCERELCERQRERERKAMIGCKNKKEAVDFKDDF